MQLITSATIAYPALSISRDGDLRVHAEPISMETANGLALRRNFFDDMLVVDADGGTYTVAAVRDRRPGNSVLGFRFMKPRIYQVTLSLRRIDPLPLEMVKNNVVKAINKNRDLWEADEMLDERLATIENALTLQEVMQAVV